MTSIDDNSNILPSCDSSWEILKSALLKSEFTFSTTLTDHYDVDEMDSEMRANYKFEPVYLGTIERAEGVYNGFASIITYKKELQSLCTQFQQNLALVVDATALSVSERTNFIADIYQDILDIDSVFSSEGSIVSHNNTSLQRRGAPWTGFWETESEHESVMNVLGSFVQAQYAFYQRLRHLFVVSKDFAPVRLEQPIDGGKHKLNLLLSRIDSIQLLLQLRKFGIISDSHTDQDLARFAEENLLWMKKPFKNVKVTIAQLKSCEKDGKTSLENIKSIISKITN